MKKITAIVIAAVCTVLFAAALAFFPKNGEKEGELSCSMRITCEELLGKEELLPVDKRELAANAEIFPEQTVGFSAGETVFDVLKRTAQKVKIHMEFSQTPIYDSIYIEGINNLYEFDAGASSGWVYSVNGVYPNYSSSLYELKDGDTVLWEYVTDKINFDY